MSATLTEARDMVRDSGMVFNQAWAVSKLQKPSLAPQLGSGYRVVWNGDQDTSSGSQTLMLLSAVWPGGLSPRLEPNGWTSLAPGSPGVREEVQGSWRRV